MSLYLSQIGTKAPRLRPNIPSSIKFFNSRWNSWWRWRNFYFEEYWGGSQRRCLFKWYGILWLSHNIYSKFCMLLCPWYSVIHNSIAPSKELCSKMALGEVGVSFPWWCHTLVLQPPGYWGLFLNLIFFHNEKMANFKGILGQSWNSEKSQISYGKIVEI